MIDPADLDDELVAVLVIAAIIYAVATLSWVFGVSVSTFAWLRHRGLGAGRAAISAGAASLLPILLYGWRVADGGSGAEFAIYLATGLVAGLVGVVTLVTSASHRRAMRPLKNDGS